MTRTNRPASALALLLSILLLAPSVGAARTLAVRTPFLPTKTRPAVVPAVRTAPDLVLRRGEITPGSTVALVELQNRGTATSGSSLVALALRDDTAGGPPLLVGLTRVPALAAGRMHGAYVPLAVPAALAHPAYRLETTLESTGAKLRGETLTRERLGAQSIANDLSGEPVWSSGSVYGEIAAGRLEHAADWGVTLADAADALEVSANADLARLDLPGLLAGAQLASQAGLADAVADPDFWTRVASRGGDLAGFDRALAERFRTSFDAPDSVFPEATALELVRIRAGYAPADANDWTALADALRDIPLVALTHSSDSYEFEEDTRGDAARKWGLPVGVCDECDEKTIADACSAMMSAGADDCTDPANWGPADDPNAPKPWEDGYRGVDPLAKIFRESNDIPSTAAPGTPFEKLVNKKGEIDTLGGDATDAADWGKSSTQLYREMQGIPEGAGPDGSLEDLIAWDGDQQRVGLPQPGSGGGGSAGTAGGSGSGGNGSGNGHPGNSNSGDSSSGNSNSGNTGPGNTGPGNTDSGSASGNTPPSGDSSDGASGGGSPPNDSGSDEDAGGATTPEPPADDGSPSATPPTTDASQEDTQTENAIATVSNSQTGKDGYSYDWTITSADGTTASGHTHCNEGTCFDYPAGSETPAVAYEDGRGTAPQNGDHDVEVVTGSDDSEDSGDDGGTDGSDDSNDESSEEESEEDSEDDTDDSGEDTDDDSGDTGGEDGGQDEGSERPAPPETNELHQPLTLEQIRAQAEKRRAIVTDPAPRDDGNDLGGPVDPTPKYDPGDPAPPGTDDFDGPVDPTPKYDPGDPAPPETDQGYGSGGGLGGPKVGIDQTSGASGSAGAMGGSGSSFGGTGLPELCRNEMGGVQMEACPYGPRLVDSMSEASSSGGGAPPPPPTQDEPGEEEYSRQRMVPL